MKGLRITALLGGFLDQRLPIAVLTGNRENKNKLKYIYIYEKHLIFDIPFIPPVETRACRAQARRRVVVRVLILGIQIFYTLKN